MKPHITQDAFRPLDCCESCHHEEATMLVKGLMSMNLGSEAKIRGGQACQHMHTQRLCQNTYTHMYEVKMFTIHHVHINIQAHVM